MSTIRLRLDVPLVVACYNSPVTHSVANEIDPSQTLTQGLGFLLVATGFTVVYITQPVLPVIEEEFAVMRARAVIDVDGYFRCRGGEPLTIS